MTDRNDSSGGSGGGGPDQGPTTIRKGFSFPSDLAYKLRMASVRRDLNEVEIVHEALARFLGHDREGGPWEPVFVQPELAEALAKVAARRDSSPERLVAEVLAEALPPPVDEDD